jgi:hypothetical protein
MAAPYGSYENLTSQNIPDYSILHCYRLENIKSYIALTGWAL